MTTDKIIEALTENSEIVIDSFLEEGLLKDVPIIGNLYKATQIAASIKDNMYKAKLAVLMKALNEAPQKFKDKVREQAMGDSDQIQNVSAKLIMVLDSITDIDKSEFIANVFISYLDSKMTSVEFRRILDVINLAFIDDLKKFVKSFDGFMSYGNYTVEALEQNGMLSLVSVSLFRVVSVSNGKAESEGFKYEDLGVTKYEYSEVGRSFAKAYHYGQRIRDEQ